MATIARPWRREVLQLYRDILRTSRLFTWTTEAGEPWGKVLAVSARTEFEAARDVDDPETIGHMLVTGRDCLMQAQAQMTEKQKSLLEDIEKSRTDR